MMTALFTIGTDGNAIVHVYDSFYTSFIFVQKDIMDAGIGQVTDQVFK
jgi:hypothetical protein